MSVCWAGMKSSHMSLSTSSISSDPTSPSGFSTMKAQLSGPTTGVYASYFNGGFSTDLAFKVEFFDVGISFNDLLGFQSNPDVGFPPTSVPFSGSGSTSLNNYTTSGNVNYRIPRCDKSLGRADSRIPVYAFGLRLRRRPVGPRERFRHSAAGRGALRGRRCVERSPGDDGVHRAPLRQRRCQRRRACRIRPIRRSSQTKES